MEKIQKKTFYDPLYGLIAGICIASLIKNKSIQIYLISAGLGTGIGLLSAQYRMKNFLQKDKNAISTKNK